MDGETSNEWSVAPRKWECEFPSQELLERTIQFWQPRSKEKLTPEDAREIFQNMTGLFYLLDKIDRKYKEVQDKTNPASD